MANPYPPSDPNAKKTIDDAALTLQDACTEGNTTDPATVPFIAALVATALSAQANALAAAKTDAAAALTAANASATAAAKVVSDLA